jgi:AcrR family transcriptional regulator
LDKDLYRNEMPISYQPAFRPDDPRARQKLRTRQAVVDAASELMTLGQTPTIPEAATLAGVSRATAYRYFPSQASLIMEVTGPIGELQSALDDTDALEPAARAGALTRRLAGTVWDNRDTLREVLRVSLVARAADPTHQRPVRRRGLIDEVLAPLATSVDRPTLDRLAAILAVLIGIEPIIVLEDIAQVDREGAIDALGWAAESLVRGTLVDAVRADAGTNDA